MINNKNKNNNSKTFLFLLSTLKKLEEHIADVFFVRPSTLSFVQSFPTVFLSPRYFDNYPARALKLGELIGAED